MTCEDTRSIISSQGEGSGQLALDLPGGQTTAPSGPRRARARAKASRGSDSVEMIQGICGRTYFDSSATLNDEASDLLSLWENRLMLRLARIGSTESALIWRKKTTPQGRSIFRLAPSTRLTNTTDCGGSLWTMVSARDWKDSSGMATEAKDGRVRLDQLPRQMVSYSPTPKHSDFRPGHLSRANDPRRSNLNDKMVGMAAYSATPRASDGEKGGPNMSFGAGGTPLPAQMHSYNPTPTVADVQGGRKTRSGKRNNEPLLNGLMATYIPTPTDKGNYNAKGLSPTSGDGLCTVMTRHLMEVGGPTTNGSSARSTEKRGAPNPEFPFWLMGWSDELISGALRAMRSFRSSRPRSSKRTSKSKK